MSDPMDINRPYAPSLRQGVAPPQSTPQASGFRISGGQPPSAETPTAMAPAPQFLPYQATYKGTAMDDVERLFIVGTDSTDMTKRTACGAVPIEGAGYLICAYTFVIGVLVLLEFVGVTHFFQSKAKPGVIPNPFEPVAKALLLCWALGNLSLSIAGGCAVYLRKPKVWLLLMFWRGLCLMLEAPFDAIMIYIGAKGFTMIALIGCAVVGMILDIYILYVCTLVLRLCMQQEAEFHNTREQDVRNKIIMMTRALQNNIPTQDEPCLFGCIPLELSVMLYAIAWAVYGVIGIASLIFYGRTIGGWALFIKTVAVPEMAWFEAVVLGLTVLCACIGLWGIAEQGFAHTQYVDLAKGEAGHLSVDDIKANMDRGKTAFQYFFIWNVIRIMLFIPITGLTIVIANVCLAYVHALTNISASVPIFGMQAPMHCTSFDVFLLWTVVGLIVLDLYMTWGSFCLWHLYNFNTTVTNIRDISKELEADQAKMAAETGSDPQSLAGLLLGIETRSYAYGTPNK